MRPSSDSRSCSARRSAHAETWANLGADFIAIEAQKLVGGASAKPEVISSAVEQIRAVNPRVPVLFGAGVKTGRDVAKALELGTVGVLLASGVVKAKDSGKVLRDLAKGLGRSA